LGQSPISRFKGGNQLFNRWPANIAQVGSFIGAIINGVLAAVIALVGAVVIQAFTATTLPVLTFVF